MQVKSLNRFFFVVPLVWREPQFQVDNEREIDRSDDANGWALGIDGDRCKRSRGKGDNGDNDGCLSLSDWLGFYFKGEFHERSQQ